MMDRENPKPVMARKDRIFNQIFFLLLSAGSGNRMKHKEKKQFLTLEETPLFIWSLKTFLFLSEQYNSILLLAYSPNDLERYKDTLNRYLEPEAVKKIKLVKGGKTRSESVYNGLKTIYNYRLASNNSKDNLQNKEIVLIHDCARPFAQVKDIITIIEILHHYPAATLGYSITDTIKAVNKESLEVTEHLNRETVKGILTPQGFHFPILWKAYEQFMLNPYPVTDDTEIVHKMGYPIKIVEGEKSNIKITTSTDFEFAKVYAQLISAKNQTFKKAFRA